MSADDHLEAYRTAGAALLASEHFALATEDVRGQALSVFARRPRSVGALVAAAAARGDEELLVFEDGPRITAAEHGRMVGALAAQLRDEHGIGAGDRVAICGANSPGWIVTAMATMALGGIVVALNSWWSAEELRHALTLTEPALLVADEKRRTVLAGVADGLPTLATETILDDLPDGDHPIEGAEVDEDDVALLQFTSGTSGRPKAAVLSHRTLLGFTQLAAFMGARSAMAGEVTRRRRPPPGGLPAVPRLGVQRDAHDRGPRRHPRLAGRPLRRRAGDRPDPPGGHHLVVRHHHPPGAPPRPPRHRPARPGPDHPDRHRRVGHPARRSSPGSGPGSPTSAAPSPPATG